jgi:glycosyltransferase involved in cell wall biosynthesis
LHVLYKLGDDHLTSIAGFYLLSRTNYYKKADVVHLHIIHGDTNISFRTVKRICREKKVVWTFHDQWAISGGCIHPFECNGVSQGCPIKCPHPRRRGAFFGKYYPRRAYKIRNNVYKDSSFDIIVSTNWMRERVLSNKATANKRIHLIPFGLDTSKFKSIDKSEARKKLGIAFNSFVIMLRNTGTDPMKGLKYSIEGLINSELGSEVVVITIDQTGGLSAIGEKYNLIELGWKDSQGLIEVLSASDVLLMPSLQESFGLMSIEAMSCGVPVIAAEGTALPNVVKNGEGGIVVPSKDSKGIADALELLYNDRIYLNQLSLTARRRAQDFYDIHDCVNKHVELYKNLYNENNYYN